MAHVLATALEERQPLDGRSDARTDQRFAFVTAGHHFLVSALPIRHPETEQALQVFVSEANACVLSEPDRDAVLLRCLRVCDGHTGGRLPTLIEQYLTHGAEPANSVDRFSACIRRVLRYQGIGDPKVQRAVAIIQERYANPNLTQRETALVVDACPTTFCTQFRRHTGVTFRNFLRDYRLDQGAALLARTNRTIKEVWASVGYNHASNFTHDFKRRFGLSPRGYRERIITTESQDNRRSDSLSPRNGVVARTGAPKTVLLVDDDECTRQWISTYLRLTGFVVDVAACGAEGLRLVESKTPDAILLDFRLSDMDGLTFLRALRKRSRSTRVAFLTADWDLFDRQAEVASLEALIVSKLCDLDTIETVVAYLVS